jgi:Ser/Thr protein kinase RdoA (MazF antagonist)
VNRARLRELGFELGARAVGGESQGAWFATAPDGTPVVLKWFPDETVADRYAVLLPALDELRARGVPVPEYPHVVAVDGWTLSAQQVLPGRSEDTWSPAVVETMVEFVAAKADIVGPRPAPDLRPWGEFVVHTLTVGEDGWAMHEPLWRGDRRSAAVLDRIEAVGADSDASWFPDDGLVHLDLHTDNVLIGDDGALSGIIDWEGACAGDHRFDLVAFAFDLDGHGQPIWGVVDAAHFDPRVLRAYVAHLTLKFTDWAIRHHTDDVPRQLDRAERVLDRYEA